MTVENFLSAFKSQVTEYNESNLKGSLLTFINSDKQNCVGRKEKYL